MRPIISPSSGWFFICDEAKRKKKPRQKWRGFAAVSTSVICRNAHQMSDIRLENAIVRNDAAFALDTSDPRGVGVAEFQAHTIT